MLLFWPCSWGLALSAENSVDIKLFTFYLMLFFLGSVLMRSAGCIFNDIVDRDIDAKVKRTKKRPLASKKISIFQALLYVLILCLLSLIILIQFNHLTIALGIGSMLLAFAYPFMKRITYWPQLFLGLTFNWGIIMAWSSIMNDVSLEIIILYLAAIFWTLGYDTIYGIQDIKDDEIIGNKSTSIKFKSNIRLFISLCYLISVSLIIYLLYPKMENNYSILFLILFILSLVYQIKIFHKDKPKSCLKAFKFNNFSGTILFLCILGISFN